MKITIDIDERDENQMRALLEFCAKLRSLTVCTEPEKVEIQFPVEDVRDKVEILFTVEDVRDKVRQLVTADPSNRAKVLDVLLQFEATTVTALSPNHYTECMTQLSAL